MRRRQMAELVLNPVQIFDQKVTPARPLAQERLNLCPSTIFKRTPFGRAPALACAGFPDAFAIIQCHCDHPLSLLRPNLAGRDVGRALKNDICATIRVDQGVKCDGVRQGNPVRRPCPGLDCGKIGNA